MKREVSLQVPSLIFKKGLLVVVEGGGGGKESVREWSWWQFLTLCDLNPHFMLSGAKATRSCSVIWVTY